MRTSCLGFPKVSTGQMVAIEAHSTRTHSQQLMRYAYLITRRLRCEAAPAEGGHHHEELGVRTGHLASHCMCNITSHVQY